MTLCVMRSLRVAGRLAAFLFFTDITWNNQTAAATACLPFAVNFNIITVKAFQAHVSIQAAGTSKWRMYGYYSCPPKSWWLCHHC